MKSILFLSSLFCLSMAQAASMTTPEATLKFVSADGHPVAGVALTGMLGYEALTAQDCTGFLCMPSLPHYKSRSEAGQVLGYTDAQGLLVVPTMEWSTDKKTAKNLKVLFFTNATFDVTCNVDGKEEYKGFVELLPQWVDGKLTERQYDCSNLEFKKDAEKEIEFKCTSTKTMEQIQAEVDKIKSTCPQPEILNVDISEEKTVEDQ